MKTLRFIVLGVILLALLRSSPGVSSKPVPVRNPFNFVQMSDPQIGFTDYGADLGRFEQAINQINGLDVAFVVICGDLVNDASEKSLKEFKAAQSRLKVPSYCAPGNHDVGNEPTPATLERYRRTIGKDYCSFEHNGCVFAVVNALLWKRVVPQESDKHDAWVKETLEAAAAKRQPVFVVSHYLLFEKDLEEPEAYFNLPVQKRKELLALFERCGVVGLLAGHTHKATSQEHHGIQMVTAETISRNFDQRPFGFRLWRIAKDPPYKHEFVPLGERP